jgi:uroporphyrinogen-III synthase
MSPSSLNGMRVLVPRGKKNAKSFSSIVEGYGGVPIEVPLLDFRPVENGKLFDPILNSLDTYDWLVFTSDVTVETFFSLLGNRLYTLPKIAAIGEKTEQALLKKEVPVHFKPYEYVAEGFVKEFSPIIEKGEKILIPKGNLARDYIAQYFKEKGHVVDEAIIYETYFPKESKAKLIQLLKEKSLDVLPFTSPSTIDHFMSVLNEYELHESIEHSIVAAIGPVSKKKCEEWGLTVHVMPEVYTSNEMIKAVATYLNSSYIKNI